MNFNASFGIANSRTSPSLGAPTSEEGDSTMQFGYLDDINFILACLEGGFFYDSGTLPRNSTGFQSENDPVNTSPSRRETTNIISISLPRSLLGSCLPTAPTSGLVL